MFLPLPAAFCLFAQLDVADRNALVRAYPPLALEYAKYRACTASPWQARLPVELVHAALEYLPPADFYTACCVCAFWRACGMHAPLISTNLAIVMENSYSSTADLAPVSPVPADVTVDRAWLYFLVAAPRRYMFKDGLRRYRVTSLDLRRPLLSAGRTGNTGVFMSDYGGIIALSTTNGLVFYSAEELLPGSADTAPNGTDLGTLVHPRGLFHAQLKDMSIAHQ